VVPIDETNEPRPGGPAGSGASQANFGGKRRAYLFGGMVIVAALVVAILVVVSSSGAGVSKPRKLTASTETATQAMIGSWVAGTAQHTTNNGSVVWGDLNAPVTDKEFIDLQCSACDEHFVGLSRTGGSEISLIPVIRAGKLKVEFFPLPSVTRTLLMLDTEWGGLLAAAQQGVGVQYLLTNYVFQPPEGSFTTANVFETARATLGLNYAAWNVARTNPRFGGQVLADLKQDEQLGYRSTPTVVFSSAEGQLTPLVGAYAASTYEQAVKQLGG
jgi:protein-disulfide isomerase